jgi:hypothetical protein
MSSCDRKKTRNYFAVFNQQFTIIIGKSHYFDRIKTARGSVAAVPQLDLNKIPEAVMGPGELKGCSVQPGC